VYVCICNAFTEKQVCIAIRKGNSSPAGVFRHLGCTPQCGKCVPTVRCMVKKNGTLDRAFEANPERVVRDPPKPPEKPIAVWINPPPNNAEPPSLN
jgi:bacterioferritin-associated ferredoxin